MEEEKVIPGIYLGERNQPFKSLILTILNKAKIKEKYIGYLTCEEGMKLYSDAFTSDHIDPVNNYQVLEQIGDLVCNQFIVKYFYTRFPQLKCSNGVKVVARLKINYGSKETFFSIAEKHNFWPFISAPNEIRHHKKRDLLEDVFEAFLGATTTILDNKVQGLGDSICTKILTSIFNEFHISLKYEDLFDAKTRLKELFDMFGEKLGPLSYDDKKETKDNITTYTCLIFRLQGAKYEIKQDGTVNMNKIQGRYNKVLLGQGSCQIKIDAQQIAAGKAIKLLESEGYIKHAPLVYQKFQEDKKRKTTDGDILKICESKEKINDLFFTRGKNKYQPKYMSTVLSHFCKERDIDGVKICVKYGGTVDVQGSDGMTCLDVLFIGKIDEEFMKVILKELTPGNIHQNVYDMYVAKYVCSEVKDFIKKCKVVKDYDDI